MMNFLERVLRTPRVVLTVMVALLIAGGVAYATLPRESFPAIDIPYFYISVSDSGVSPADAERLLGKPIEEKIKDIDGLTHYTTTATQGFSSVLLEFDVNTNKDKAEADVRAALEGISATPQTIADGSYPLYITLYLAAKVDSPKQAAIDRFIAFLNSDTAKTILRKHGLVPYSDATDAIARNATRTAFIDAHLNREPATAASRAPSSSATCRSIRSRTTATAATTRPQARPMITPDDPSTRVERYSPTEKATSYARASASPRR